MWIILSSIKDFGAFDEPAYVCCRAGQGIATLYCAGRFLYAGDAAGSPAGNKAGARQLVRASGSARRLLSGQAT
jgi:hypothetical protein